MLPNKKEHPKEKTSLHPRNKHRERYDFKQLIASCPDLGKFVKLNKYGDESLDFFNPEAVKLLNKVLLKDFYGIENWDIPENYLCPPIPGRADYIHHIADLLSGKITASAKGKILKGSQIKVLDIGVGANCVYPIIGVQEYGWSFIGVDIDTISLESASKIIASNPSLKGKIELRKQGNPKSVFCGIIQKGEFIDVTICNPPFHASLAEATAGAVRKVRTLKKQKIKNPTLNFGGQGTELYCDGGEAQFIRNMIEESSQFGTSCCWFSTLVSKQSNLESAYQTLENRNAVEVKTIPMAQGNKISRILAWTFLNKKQQKMWREIKN